MASTAVLKASADWKARSKPKTRCCIEATSSLGASPASEPASTESGRDAKWSKTAQWAAPVAGCPHNMSRICVASCCRVASIAS